MNRFTRLFSRKKEERGICSLALNYSGAKTTSRPLRLAAVYRCVEVISDSVAQLTVAPYRLLPDGGSERFTEHPAYLLLAKEPSPVMSSFTLLKSIVVSMLLEGNGYAYIRRDQMGNPRELIFIPPGYVDVKMTNAIPSIGEITYDIKGIGNGIPPRDVIHILNHTTDGVHGISTLTHAAATLSLADASENHAAGFFTGGANVGGVLTTQGPLNQKQADDIKAKWNNAFGPVGTPNGVAVLPGNMTFQPITVNPSDAQLLETRQYSVVDICRFFGVSPVKCFDLSHSSYSTVEATQLAFLTDTLAPILKKIALEFERKLFRDDEKFKIEVRFDTSELLRADMASRSTFMQSLFNMGALSINEARHEVGMSPIEGGGEHFVQVNLQTLNNALHPKQDGTQY